MNFNALIAVLVLKSVLTEDEAERLVEHLNDKPQSTVLRDAIAAVTEVIGKPQPSILPQLGPVGPAQMQEELAARALPPVAPPAPEPQLAANEATVDTDQADDKPTAVADPPAGQGETFTPDTDKDAKPTSVKKPSETAAEK